MKVSIIKNQWKEKEVFIFGVINWGGKEGRVIGLFWIIFTVLLYVFYWIFFNLIANKLKGENGK